MNADRLRDRRRARLRAEISDAGLDLRLTGRVGDALLAEIDYARFPPVHERNLPTYGAVLLAETAPDPEDLGAVVHRAARGGEDALRLMADGRQGFLLVRRRQTALMVLPTPHDREGELVRLRERFGPARFAAVQRIANGVVRVFGRSVLAVWDGSQWWGKPYAATYARAVLRAVPEASRAGMEAVLEFCVHTMSPAPAGATLVWALDRGLMDQLRQDRVPVLPAVSLENRTNFGPLRQLLSQTDGAALLSPDVELVDIGLYLRGSQEAYDAVREDLTHGTRHASAGRFTFDNRGALAFVVSEDGPVTVYSKGKVVASIRSPVGHAVTE